MATITRKASTKGRPGLPKTPPRKGRIQPVGSGYRAFSGKGKEKGVKTVVKAARAPKAPKKTYRMSKAAPKPVRKAAAPARTAPPASAIKPRKVTGAGSAIGAAHQSFFDIGKFLSGK